MAEVAEAAGEVQVVGGVPGQLAVGGGFLEVLVLPVVEVDVADHRRGEGRESRVPPVLEAAQVAGLGREAVLVLVVGAEHVVEAPAVVVGREPQLLGKGLLAVLRSEEHTSELQSLMRSSYAVFCSKKKNNDNENDH